MYNNVYTQMSLCTHALTTDESCILNGQSDLPERYKQYLRDLWQAEFLPVAQALLSRIECHHTDLVPLELPTPSP